jgi:hypothetical protein
MRLKHEPELLKRVEEVRPIGVKMHAEVIHVKR